jgi:hypothetical protein
MIDPSNPSPSGPKVTPDQASNATGLDVEPKVVEPHLTSDVKAASVRIPDSLPPLSSQNPPPPAEKSWKIFERNLEAKPASIAPIPKEAEPIPSQSSPPSATAKATPDVERRLKPSVFFKNFAAPIDSLDPTQVVVLQADTDFMKVVEQDVAEARSALQSIGEPSFLFPSKGSEGRLGALSDFKEGDSLALSSISKDRPLLVIGDVHGDVWSFAAALRLAREPEMLCKLQLVPPGTQSLSVVLLGDLVDRGTHHAECVILCLKRLKGYPNETVWVVGNHDIGHRWDPDNERFVADIEPGEFTDWLNEGEDDERKARTRFGRAFIEYVQAQPRAVAFKSGLLAVHGGVPHCDLFHHFGTLKDLQTDARAKDDFTWLRVAESAPKKFPNRLRRGCELGTEQLVASVDHISRLLQKAGHDRITAVVRGHDHHPERHYVHKAGFPPMSLLTINTMGIDPTEPPASATTMCEPCVGIYAEGEVPRVVQIRRRQSQVSVTASAEVTTMM